MMTNLTVRITESLQRELERLGRRRQRRVSEVVPDSLRRYIADGNCQAVRKKTLPFAGARGFLADEHVFKVRS